MASPISARAQANFNKYESDENIIPHNFKCAVTLDIMQDPTTLKCNHTFEKTSISQYRVIGGGNCPECRRNIRSEDLRTNIPLKNSIREFGEKTLTYLDSVEQDIPRLQNQISTEDLKCQRFQEQIQELKEEEEVLKGRLLVEMKETGSIKNEQEILKQPLPKEVLAMMSELNGMGRRITLLEDETSNSQREIIEVERERIEEQALNNALQSERISLTERAVVAQEEIDVLERRDPQLTVEILAAKIDRNENQNRLADLEIADKEQQIRNSGYKKVGIVGLAAAGLGLAAFPYGYPLAWLWGMNCAGMSMSEDQRQRQYVEEKRQKEVEIQERNASTERNQNLLNQINAENRV